MNISELDNYCRLYNRCIIARHGKLVGIVKEDYEVRQR